MSAALITGFDHIVIAVRDLDAGVAAYEALLGVVARRSESDGMATAALPLSNISVELMAPLGESEAARRLRAALANGDGLKSLVLATRDIDALHRRLGRVGVLPEAIVERETHRSFRANTESTHGVRLFFLERASASRIQAADVDGVDHIVIRTPDAERAAALYGARLGLDMRLDRMVMERRLMFFRCGDAIVEIIHDDTLTDGRDRLWGVSWRVRDAEAARDRLAQAGADVSEVRAGMKPGTRVFTVRDGTCGVPTLMIEQASKPD